MHSIFADALRRTREFAHWSLANVPWGIRSLLGLVFLAGGVFSFLPVLGIWMAPIGIVLISLDVPPWRNQILRWLRRRQKQEENGG